MSYKKRRIEVEFQLAVGHFDNDNNNSLKLSGLRCEAVISNEGNILLSKLNLKIYGMLESDMNRLSTLNISKDNLTKNKVIITAGDDSGMTQIFEGTISSAFASYSTAPVVPLVIVANSNYLERIIPAAANSYKGASDVATIIESIASSIGFSFKNNGVTARLSNQYLSGTAIMQIKRCAEAAQIGAAIENGSVEIWPKGGVRDSVEINISPTKGLVGYPSFSPSAVTFKCLFTPDMQKGRRLNVESSLEQATGAFYIESVTHSISTMVDGAPWFTTASASRMKINDKK